MMYLIYHNFYKKTRVYTNEYNIHEVNGKPHTWSKKSAAFAGGEY